MLSRPTSARQNPPAVPSAKADASPFAIWKTGRPFDPKHYPWAAPAHADAEPTNQSTRLDGSTGEREQAAGHTPDEPARSVVTATCAASVAQAGAAVWLDFTHIKGQLPMQRLLDHLGLTSRLKGSGPQRRCACPVHRGDPGAPGHLQREPGLNRYQCFDATCQSQGDVIDLWAALHQQDLRTAALDLVETFGLEPAPRTEKRNG
jgi:hypothetical protein